MYFKGLMALLDAGSCTRAISYTELKLLRSLKQYSSENFYQLPTNNSLIKKHDAFSCLAKITFYLRHILKVMESHDVSLLFFQKLSFTSLAFSPKPIDKKLKVRIVRINHYYK